MIRFRLKERIADWEFQEGRKLTLEEIAKATNIHRTTLSKISNIRSYNTTTSNIDVLCQFFNCEVKDFMEVIPDHGEES